jgi:sortase (surface protein transpeptidase)
MPAAKSHERDPPYPVKNRLACLLLAGGLTAAGVGAIGLTSPTGHAGENPWPIPHVATPSGSTTGPPQLAALPSGRAVAPPPRYLPEAAALPVSLTIPAIGVRTRLIRVGLTTRGTMQVPASTLVAGWYTYSSRPGALGSAVIVGHIDSYRGPGVFFRLRLLRPGDQLYVTRADGSIAAFRVYAVRTYPKATFPIGSVYGSAPDPELRLITCGGAFDYRARSYLSNVVVYSSAAG